MTFIRIFLLQPRIPISLFHDPSHHITRPVLYRYLSQRSLLQLSTTGEFKIVSSFHELETNIRTQCNSYNFDKTSALKLFDVMLNSHSPPSVMSFNILLTRVRRLGDSTFVIRIYKTSLGADIVSPDVYTYGILIESYCRLGRLDLGFGVLSDMIKRGCNPNIVVFNSLIDGLCKQGRIRGAMDLFERMHEFGCIPSVITYGVLINFYCKIDQIESGLAVLGCSMKSDCRLNVVTLSCLMDVLCKHGRIRDVMDLFHRMPELGCMPDAVTYGVLINCSCKIDQIEFGLAVLGCLLKSGVRPDIRIYNTLVHGFFKTDKFLDAIHLLRRISDMGCTANLITYNTIINYCVQNNFIDIGFGIFTKLLKDGMKPNVITLSSLIHGLSQADKLVEATSLFLRFHEMGFAPYIITYGTLINAYFRDNNADTVEVGFGIFTKLLKDGMEPSIIILSSLIHGLCQADKLVEATSLFLRFPDMGFTPNVITYGILINGYFTNNNTHTVELGFGVFGDMLKRGHCPNTIVYTAMVKGLCAINRVDEAGILVEKMYAKLSCSPDVMTYNTLLNGLCCAGDTHGALKLLRDMESNKKIHLCKPNKVTYTTIIYSLCRMGGMDEALKLLGEMYASKSFA
ncbi:hypothetical protein ZOSMA_9G00510 [Zostera marina]|uniref:Pentatricopeptide repeat-containing protein n=1 Tax=Zostera marina TaxID=29655 RepID=A0A0K9NH42_ZOSMR|nr:hypothetical protein ZOSMA_9G00510 [Zostera marina]